MAQNSDNSFLQEILPALESHYQSLVSPRFFFVQEASDKGKYEEETNFFIGEFAALDDTDPNNDVGVFLRFQHGNHDYCILLSFVGPYAAFLKFNENRCSCLTPLARGLTTKEQKALSFLRERGFAILDKVALSQPVEIQLDIENPTVYNALFTCTPSPLNSAN